MLTISTIPEALAELAEQTGRAWTDSELFDVAARHGIELHAAPPITAQTTIQKFIAGVGMVEKFRSGPGHSRLAVLFPWQVGQLWLSGETMATQTEKHDEVEGEYQWFTEPVRVTREQIRIKAATLNKILTVWSNAQPAPAQTTPAPVEAETTAQRRIRYLELFEAEERNGKRGALTRLAAREGVDRANMKKDIDKARGTRTAQTRAGASWGSQLVRGR